MNKLCRSETFMKKCLSHLFHGSFIGDVKVACPTSYSWETCVTIVGLILGKVRVSKMLRLPKGYESHSCSTTQLQLT